MVQGQVADPHAPLDWTRRKAVKIIHFTFGTAKPWYVHGVPRDVLICCRLLFVVLPSLSRALFILLPCVNGTVRKVLFKSLICVVRGAYFVPSHLPDFTVADSRRTALAIAKSKKHLTCFTGGGRERAMVTHTTVRSPCRSL